MPVCQVREICEVCEGKYSSTSVCCASVVVRLEFIPAVSSLFGFAFLFSFFVHFRFVISLVKIS